MKILRGVSFSLLAVLAVLCFVAPFAIVPQKFISSTRAATIDRLSAGDFEVDEAYVDASVNEAVKENFPIIFKTALLIAALATLIVCFVSFRAPHDAGGINLFNPFSLPLLFIIAVSTALTISFALDALPGRSVTEFRDIIAAVSGGFTGTEHTLLILLLLPALVEFTFRGLVYSFLEKLHFIPAILVSSLAYAVVAYLAFSKYGTWSLGSSASAIAAFFVALGMGLILCCVTWRLRSVIPAVLMGALIANSSLFIRAFEGLGNAALPVSLVALVASLAALVSLPALFAKRFPVFAYDFPFTERHERMKKRRQGKSANNVKKKRKQSDNDGTA